MSLMTVGTKKMGFNIRVGRFNSRGGALVEVGDFLGESIGKFFCHREPDSIRKEEGNLEEKERKDSLNLEGEGILMMLLKSLSI